MKRDDVRAMFGNRCAYCGCTLDKTFHIDHVAPIYRGWNDKPFNAGEDVKDNLFPSCPRCNLWKKAFSIEEFRHEIEVQYERLRKYSAPFRLAEDYKILEPTNKKVVFYFEQFIAISPPTPSPQQ